MVIRKHPFFVFLICFALVILLPILGSSNPKETYEHNCFKKPNTSCLLTVAFSSVENSEETHYKARIVASIALVQHTSGDITAQTTLKSALGLANGIIDKSWRADTLVFVGKIQAKMGMLTQARQILETAWKIADSIEISCPRSAKLAMVSIAASELGFLDWALSGATTIEKEDDRERALSVLAETYFKTGEEEEALKIAQAMVNSEKREKTYLSFARTLATSGRIEQSIQQVEALASDLEKASAFSEIGVILAKSGHMLHAKKMWTRSLDAANYVMDERLQPKALARTAVLQALLGQQKGAAETLFEAVKMAEEIEKKAPRTQVILIILLAQAEAGLFEDALNTLNNLKSFKKKSTRNKALIAIIRAMANANAFSESWKITHSISSEFWKQQAIVAIVSSQIDQNLLDEALKSVNKIQDTYEQAELLIRMAALLSH